MNITLGDNVCISDMFMTKKYCYVRPESRCEDKVASKLVPGLYWSSLACADQDNTGGGETPLTSDQGDRHHQTWSWPADTGAQCVGQCASSEMCHTGMISYNVLTRLCSFTIDPHYLITL